MSGPQTRAQTHGESGSSHGGSQSSRAGMGSTRSSISKDSAGSLVVTFSSEVPLDVQRFIRILLSHDEQAAHAFAAELIERGVTTERLYEGLFADAARTLGEMWETDDCTFYDVTLGTGRIQRLIREFSHQFLADYLYPGSTGRLLLCSAADEQHSLGIAVLAEFFVRDGWDVHVGPGLGSEAFLDKVRESDYNLLGFSVACTGRISKLQQDIRRARQVSRNRDIKVIVGGALITADPSLAERIGADGYAIDASTAIAAARRIISA
jgi:MerR family transcriptional regulator, light-induced transcriptional regulator